MDNGKSKDTEKTLIQGQFLESEVLQTGGKAIQNKAQKLSELYANAKKDLLTPTLPQETNRISTLDHNTPKQKVITNSSENHQNLILNKKNQIKQHSHTVHTAVNKTITDETTSKRSIPHKSVNLSTKDIHTSHKNVMNANNKQNSQHSDSNNYESSQLATTQSDPKIHESVYERFFHQNESEDLNIYDKIKTLVKDSVTVDKQLEALSDTGKTIEKVGTLERKVARTNKRIKSIEEDDGTGRSIYGNEIKQQTARKTTEYSKKIKSNVGKKISTNKYFIKFKKVIKQVTKKLIKKLMLFLSSISIFSLPLILTLAICVTVLSIFGGGDESVVEKYESYMTAIQASYDAEVDEWLEQNPKGIVIGVRGNYGDIDWKVPLSIIQGVYSGLELDNSELIMLKRFYDAGLFEKHEEITDEIEVIDIKGKKKKIKFKYLAISNPGYHDYMKWLNNNYAYINEFKTAKDIPTSESLTDQEKENIESLYQSDSFFDAFSTEFQDHTTITGSNTAETDYDSPEYNQLNPFTSSGYKGQCTWYAYGRALKVTGKKMPLGNAAMWIQNAKAMGLATGSQPSKNAVVVLAGNNFGHVAFVESWDGTSITISEGNYNNPCASGQCNAVEYANKHYGQLVHQATYDSLEAFKAAEKSIGLIVIGFIYTD